MGVDEGGCGYADVEVFIDPLGELLVGLRRGSGDGEDGVVVWFVVLAFVHDSPLLNEWLFDIECADERGCSVLVQRFEGAEDLGALFAREEEGERGGEVVLVGFVLWLWDLLGFHARCSCVACVYARGWVRSLKAA